MRPTNKDIADTLNNIAELLEAQDGNPFRVRAYRRAANTIRDRNESIAQLVRAYGQERLVRIPTIGKSLSGAIAEIVYQGYSSQLERLQGKVSPEDVFMNVPGIGDHLASRISEELDIESLAELELAAHTGRLRRIEGFGPRRTEAVRQSLAGMLSASARRRALQYVVGEYDEIEDPPVDLLLKLDKEYRRKAQTGDLTRIAPKRFNPHNDAWLPIMHTSRHGWEFTILYSNTKRAHELNKTSDWVVIYFELDGLEGQCTVVTEINGDLKGKRVIRGRESEIRDYYAAEPVH